MSGWFERFGRAEVADGLMTGSYPCDEADVAALAADGITPDQALAQIKRRKPSAEPLPHQLEDLHRWWRLRAGS